MECEKEENKHYEKQGFPSSVERWAEWKFCFGEVWPFNAFVMLKTTFSKHRFIKISMTCVHIKPEVLKKKKQQQWLQLQMKLV